MSLEAAAKASVQEAGLEVLSVNASPLVSVIIPVYNGAKTLMKTLGSLQAQTFQDFEVVVINDGSTDETVSLLTEVDDPKIHVFSYENGGLPTARNRGIERARGEFLTFLDADDCWDQHKLQDQLEALRNAPEAGVVYSGTAFIDESDRLLFARDEAYASGDIYPQLLIRNFISSGSNILLRREVAEAVGGFDPTLKSVEDWDYYLRLAAKVPFAVVPKLQIFYRQSSSSMTANLSVMESASLRVIERAFRQAPPELQSLKSKSLANLYRYLTKQCIGQDPRSAQLKAAWVNLLKALRWSPKILAQRETQRLLAKLLVMVLIPATLSQRLLDWIRTHLPMVAVKQDLTSQLKSPS